MEEIYEKLLKDRIVFLSTPIDEQAANLIVSQLLFLEAEDRQKDISLYVNSPGGAIPASMAIYDTITTLKPDVTTVCAGKAGGTAALIVARGARGKRFALPSAFFELIPLKTTGNEPQSLEMVNELIRLQKLIIQAFHEVTGQTLQRIEEDMRGNLRLNAQEAITYGLIDGIIQRGASQPFSV